jgi:hypothetical protein
MIIDWIRRLFWELWDIPPRAIYHHELEPFSRLRGRTFLLHLLFPNTEVPFSLSLFEIFPLSWFQAVQGTRVQHWEIGELQAPGSGPMSFLLTSECAAPSATGSGSREIPFPWNSPVLISCDLVLPILLLFFLFDSSSSGHASRFSFHVVLGLDPFL